MCRLRSATDEQEEGARICIEIIEQVREIEGVAGIHVMAYRQEELVAEIVERAGLLSRRGARARDRKRRKSGKHQLSEAETT